MISTRKYVTGLVIAFLMGGIGGYASGVLAKPADPLDCIEKPECPAMDGAVKDAVQKIRT